MTISVAPRLLRSLTKVPGCPLRPWWLTIGLFPMISATSGSWTPKPGAIQTPWRPLASTLPGWSIEFGEKIIGEPSAFMKASAIDMLMAFSRA